MQGELKANTANVQHEPVQVYEDVKSLRYGHLMIMTDQDHDGSHIKGLIMNFLHTFYPSLLRLPGFLLEFITPIIKVRQQQQKDTLLQSNQPLQATATCCLVACCVLGTATTADAYVLLCDLHVL